MPLFKDTTPGATFADRIRKAGEHRPMPAAQSRAVHRHEKREERKPVFANATLLLASGKVAAVVTNVNALGVRVEFTGGATLQGEVTILAPTLGLNRRARAAWQQNGNAGLVFLKDVEGEA